MTAPLSPEQKLLNAMRRKRQSVPDDLSLFTKHYMKSKEPNNWHHELFYGILDNTLIQDNKTGLIMPNPGVTLTNPIKKDPVTGWDPTKHADKAEKKNNSILMFAPRGHAKSTCVTQNYPVWELYRNPNLRILIVSANQEIATGFVRAIMWQLENNNDLKDTFGDLVPMSKRKWGERAFIVERDTKEKDPSVVGIGVGGKLISRRADIIIVDDLLDIETARTPAQRKKTKEWFENVLLPILEEGGRLVIVGTAWYKNDLLDELYKEGNFDVKLKLKALVYNSVSILKGKAGTSIRDHTWKLPYDLNQYPKALDISTILSPHLISSWGLTTYTENGVLWYPKWSYDKLINKKESQNMSDAAFSRQYLNEPMSEQDKLFKERYLQEALARGNNKRMFTRYDNLNLVGMAHWGTVLAAVGLDLAISKKRTSDDTALAVWGLTENKTYVLLHADVGKWGPEETKQKVMEAQDNFNPIKIKVENVAFQDMMRQQLQDDDIPVEGFMTSSSKKFNEETGIARLANLFEQGRVGIPASKADGASYKVVQRLLGEMLDYTFDGHMGDLLAASWFAIDALMEFDKKMLNNRGFFSNNALLEQTRNVAAPHKIFIMNTKPRLFRFAFNSFLHIYHPVKEGEDFIGDDERFYIFATKEEKGIAYLWNMETKELMAKVEGNTSALMFASLLEKLGQFFNNAQVVVDQNGEGGAVLMDLATRNYPKLFAMQPDANGMLVMKDGFKIDERTLPIALDRFRLKINEGSLLVKDNKLTTEMSEIIEVQGNKITTAHSDAQRVKTFAVGYWLMDNYEKVPEKLYNRSKALKKSKSLNVPYKVFKYGK